MTARSRHVLVSESGALSRGWPFTWERLVQRLHGVADVTQVDGSKESFSHVDWNEIDAVALFGGELTENILDEATHLRVVGGITDAQGPSCLELLCRRGIPARRNPDGSLAHSLSAGGHREPGRPARR